MADREEEVFCHLCHRVWPRGQYGLTCPNCDSEFTEIIDQDSDLPIHEHGNEPTPEPETRSPPSSRSPHPFADHNPWADTDEQSGVHEYGDGRGFTRRSYQSPDGRFSFTTTTITSGSPLSIRGTLRGGTIRGSVGSGQQDPFVPMLRSFSTIFQGLAGPGLQQDNTPQSGNQHYHWSSTPGSPNSGEFHSGDGNVRGTFRATGGLFPRDAEGPQPMPHPLGNINDILNLFRLEFPPDGHEDGPHVRGGVRLMADNPLSIISAMLNGGRHGDAVYSQEELDRVISQLIDQNMNGNAPPPASESAIQALPKKQIDKDMLGPDGKAECSICMEAVEIGTEVTVLPCKHWFHYSCIEMWLSQHNTCPHCRQGINSAAQNSPGNTRENPMFVPSSPEGQPTSRHASHSGNHQYHRHESSSTPSRSGHGSASQPPPEHPRTERRRSSRSEGGSGNSGGGITGWVRSHFGGS